MTDYCGNPYRYQRRVTREVAIGNVGVGGTNPIRVQSMITCDTMDTEASIAQTVELAGAGCEIVRAVNHYADSIEVGRVEWLAKFHAIHPVGWAPG